MMRRKACSAGRFLWKTYNKHPWFIKGKGPNGPKSKYWGEGLAEADAAAEAEASGSDPS